MTLEPPEHPAPLTAAQVAVLRQQPGFGSGNLPLLAVLLWQLATGLVVTGLAWLVTQQAHSAASAFYGMLAVVVPGACFAWGVQRWQRLTANLAGGFLAMLMGWELAKVILTIVMLALAPKVLAQPDWLALLAGFVVTLKVYWLALWFSFKVQKKPVAS